MANAAINLPGSPIPFPFALGTELRNAARCICWFCRKPIVEWRSRRWRNFSPSHNTDLEVEFMGATLRARAHKECAQGKA